jgi:hypothetical protein
MPIHRFRCKLCGSEQDELFILSTDNPDRPDEPCGNCGAHPSKLERLMSAATPIGPIFSNVTEVAPGWSARFQKNGKPKE